MIPVLLNALEQFDTYSTQLLASNRLTSSLIITPLSKFITQFLIISFIGLISYETLYWSGIYLNVWEYHAKDIFKEIPIHCAHVYVRLNLIDQADEDKLNQYYQLKRKYHILKLLDLNHWNNLNQTSQELFKLNRFVKYHFEFSPEDFEMNQDPEYGSNIGHLRQKVLNLFNESDIYNAYKPKDQKLINTNHFHLIRIYNI
ncbi:hypothetical protein DFJ63DRAFT_335041 [Scheffersomyces coipomensis]|uniref:uncharacterized protein n=1 Tax=Scheffersomyces coipomensis TaxID=1788519 RepID=UPI00315D2867